MIPQAIRDSQSFAATVRFVYQFLSAATWVYENIVRPVTKPFRVVIAYLWRWYRRLWDKVVYLKTGHFSRTRAGMLLAVTIAVLYILPAVALFTAQLGLYFATVDRNEVLYLSQTQEIKPDEDIHSVEGCAGDRPDCNDQDTVSYRILPTPFNHLWSLVHHGHVFYPDYVAAAIHPGLNKCVATVYGIREKFLVRNWDIHPEILSVQCTAMSLHKD